MRVAVLGLGEAGRLYAHGLAASGAEVTGFDPVAESPVEGVRREASIAAAVEGTDVVLSLVGAVHAPAVLREALAAMRPPSFFADLNTGSPSQKLQLASEAQLAGIPFADVAIMAPVPRAAEKTAILVSGDGAPQLTAMWSELNLPVENVGTTAGTAAGLKLLRSVFMKGLAGLVFESVSAASMAGSADWLRGQIAGELGPDGAALVDRLIDGTRAHAERREHEMLDTRDYLESLGAPTWMTAGTIEWLHALAEDPSFPVADPDR